MQIYCDFSGYTDIAIGSARLLGIRFPKNFDAPYTAASIQDFWRRWHISLSTWLRDYLYIPLGGSRHGAARTALNLMLTMLLGGLWHGANWTFVAWGGMHGAALAVTRALERARERRGAARPNRKAPPRRWAFSSRSTSCARRGSSSARTPSGPRRASSPSSERSRPFTRTLPLSVLAALSVGLGAQFVPKGFSTFVRGGFARLPFVAQGAVLFATAVALRQMGSADAVPFVYFQF